MENEKILEKIKKLFALAENNPSENEAKEAALKAQQLLAKYHLSAAEVENIDLDKIEEIEEVTVDIPAKKWKYTLAQIVAENFRCRHFYYGKKKLIFYGHATDARIAAETFKYLFKIGNQLGNRLYYEAKCAYKSTENVYNSCVMGFCEGVRQALAEQSKALMVITPEDVISKFRERTAFAKTMHTSAPRAYNGSAYEKGRQSGYETMSQKKLAG